MAPITLTSLQPFKTVHENWSSIKPYYENYMTTISFASVLMAFLGTLSMMVKHGLKIPRLHPMMETVDLDVSHEHPNEYITEEDLINAKLFEFERTEMRRLDEAKSGKAVRRSIDFHMDT